MSEEEKKLDKKEKTPYEVLRDINVNNHVEQKNGLSYLSWVWALDTLYMNYPESVWEIVKTPDGKPYWTDGATCWVDVIVRIVKDGEVIQEREEPAYPVMDYRNKSIRLENLTSMDVNTAIQRALTKCIARHGLGFYIYAGEDLPQVDAEKQAAELIKEYQQIESELAKAGIDRHAQKFIDWVLVKAKVEGVTTLDPGVLISKPAEMKKIMSAMRSALKMKEDKA